ncbi:MAG: ABC transporter ATP-binding protein [Wenzhouxiangella sp.]|nr:MAG: ABC transporter ATP-binding protein [Wenzhouxiangella sp.]
MVTPLLTVHNLETSYGPVMALRGVSLSVPEGSIVTVLGSNGAGKTTLMRTLSGVLVPRKGSVRYRSKRIDGLEPDRLVGEGIVHVPEGREVFPFMSVIENLRMGAYTRRDRSALGGDLDMVHEYFPVLAKRRDQEAGTLSGGEQQMLAIARGLMAKPSLMLLDEPSLGLSPVLVGEIFGIIRRLNQEQGLTIILVEQNARAALEVADHGYVLEVGRIVMDDKAERLLASDDIREFYLGKAVDGSRGRRRWRKRKSWR